MGQQYTNTPLIQGSDRLAFGFSARGRGHIKKSILNQDSFQILYDESSSVYVAVVSDGAGSAKNSQIGSSTCADFLAKKLLDIGINFVTKKLANNQLNEKIDLSIIQLREKLDPTGKSLRGYHHTLSAVLMSPLGGVIIQIGDSPIIVTKQNDNGDQNSISDINRLLEENNIYDEEKGEYANETHFVTQVDWKKNLKVTPLPKGFDAVFLMTDGAASAYISKGKLYLPSMSKTLAEICNSPSNACEIVESYLTHPDLDSITSDDKTFVGIVPLTWLKTPVDHSFTLPKEQQTVTLLPPVETAETKIETSININNGTQINTKKKDYITGIGIGIGIALIISSFFGDITNTSTNEKQPIIINEIKKQISKTDHSTYNTINIKTQDTLASKLNNGNQELRKEKKTESNSTVNDKQLKGNTLSPKNDSQVSSGNESINLESIRAQETQPALTTKNSSKAINSIKKYSVKHYSK